MSWSSVSPVHLIASVANLRAAAGLQEVIDVGVAQQALQGLVDDGRLTAQCLGLHGRAAQGKQHQGQQSVVS